MENRNIYKMDDVLIILSWIMLIPAAFFAWPWLRTLQNASDFNSFISSAPGLLGSRMNGTLLYAAGAVSTQFAGRVIRHREKQSLKILDVMKYTGKTSVDQLALTCGMSAPRARSLVRKLARIPSLNLFLEKDTVRQGIRKTVSYERPVYKVRTPAPEPSGEGESPSRSAEKKEIPPELQAIMKDRSTGMVQKLKKLQEYGKEHPDSVPPVLKSYSRDIKPEAAAESGEKGRANKFHTALFVILFLTPLWPIALIYGISYAVRQNKIRLSQGDPVNPK